MTIADGEQRFSVSSVLVHSLYDPIAIAYDYSILRLSSSVNVASANSFAGVVCLPPDTTEQFVGTNLTVSGWGRFSNETTTTSTVLKATFLTGISNTQCSQTFNVGAYNLCALKSGTGSCQGDSGGIWDFI